MVCEQEKDRGEREPESGGVTGAQERGRLGVRPRRPCDPIRLVALLSESGGCRGGAGRGGADHPEN